MNVGKLQGVDAVLKPHPGTSYNPDYDAHQVQNQFHIHNYDFMQCIISCCCFSVVFTETHYLLLLIFNIYYLIGPSCCS